MSTLFGIGVLATGWHRPSDTLAAYLVCVLVFAVVTAALMCWNSAPTTEFGEVEQRLSTGAVAVFVVAVALAAGAALVVTLRRESWETVDHSVRYLAVVASLKVLAALVIIGYHQVLRGVSLDPAPSRHPDDTRINDLSLR